MKNEKLYLHPFIEKVNKSYGDTVTLYNKKFVNEISKTASFDRAVVRFSVKRKIMLRSNDISIEDCIIAEIGGRSPQT